VRGNDDGDYNFCLLIGKVLGTFFFLLLFYPDRKRRRLRTRQHYKRARINRKLQAAAASITRLNVTSYILFILAMCTIGSYPFRPNFRGSSNFYSPKSLHCGSFALVSFLLLLFFFVSFISFHVSFLFLYRLF
jgi:hypothetical protein